MFEALRQLIRSFNLVNLRTSQDCLSRDLKTERRHNSLDQFTYNINGIILSFLFINAIMTQTSFTLYLFPKIICIAHWDIALLYARLKPDRSLCIWTQHSMLVIQYMPSSPITFPPTKTFIFIPISEFFSVYFRR